MTPAARVQAAIELLDQVIDAARNAGPAADTLIARYFATRRYAGSKDRRAVRDLVYAAIRRSGEIPDNGRAAMLGLAADNAELAVQFDGSPHGPEPISPNEPSALAGVAPRWLVDRLTASGLSEQDIAALNERAPLDIRVNRLRADPATVRADLPDAEPIAGLPDGLRLPAGINIEQSPLWHDGAIEVQDAGSQVVSMAVPAQPGDRVIDLCAGAGGKTLTLAAAMNNRGEILACDVDRTRLSRLAPRAERAGVTIAQPLLLNPGREAVMLGDRRHWADHVVIDAPCSGTGTWRRNPEARWRLTPARLDRLVATQQGLLDVARALVKPGGTLTYIVCSLLDAEGRGQIAAFLAANPGWQADGLGLPAGAVHGDGVRLLPSRDWTDGFFVARLRPPC